MRRKPAPRSLRSASLSSRDAEGGALVSTPAHAHGGRHARSPWTTALHDRPARSPSEAVPLCGSQGPGYSRLRAFAALSFSILLRPSFSRRSASCAKPVNRFGAGSHPLVSSLFSLTPERPLTGRSRARFMRMPDEDGGQDFRTLAIARSSRLCCNRETRRLTEDLMLAAHPAHRQLSSASDGLGVG